ncbi:hypothetical protein LJC12_02940 [Odoribacter sp. OttesenSCG-928-J03]|nr:hypothetical protein [Odoribacter sp. OttesenSCG-928-J03]MDL2330869.1 hypothetical protein [Odoribacter sp. OttesenSCG-928-A06]
MKKIILIFTICLYTFTGYSQELFKYIGEVKASTYTYKKYDNGYNSEYYVHNKSNFIEDLDRELKGGQNIKIELTNRAFLENLIKTHVYPVIKDLIPNLNKVYVSMEVIMASDMDGNIKEVYFSYPKKWNIPITAIEEIEKGVLLGKMTLKFQKNNYFLREAQYVLYRAVFGKNYFKKQLDAENSSNNNNNNNDNSGSGSTSGNRGKGLIQAPKPIGGDL